MRVKRVGYRAPNMNAYVDRATRSWKAQRQIGDQFIDDMGTVEIDVLPALERRAKRLMTCC